MRFFEEIARNKAGTILEQPVLCIYSNLFFLRFKAGGGSIFSLVFNLLLKNLGDGRLLRLCCVCWRGYVALFRKTKATLTFGLGWEFDNTFY